MIIAISVVFAFILIFFIAGFALSAPAYKGPLTEHFNGNTFVNPGGVKEQHFRDVLIWMLNRKQSAWRKAEDETPAIIPDDQIHSGIRVTFINHSTFLIQTAGLNILTDPVWSTRVSPFTWSGPKRQRNPESGLRISRRLISCC